MPQEILPEAHSVIPHGITAYFTSENTKFFSAKIRDIFPLVWEFLELVQEFFGRGHHKNVPLG